MMTVYHMPLVRSFVGLAPFLALSIGLSETGTHALFELKVMGSNLRLKLKRVG